MTNPKKIKVNINITNEDGEELETIETLLTILNKGNTLRVGKIELPDGTEYTAHEEDIFIRYERILYDLFDKSVGIGF